MIQVSHSLNFIVVKKLKEVIASLVLRTVVKPLPYWWSTVPHCIWLNFFNYRILNYFRKLNTHDSKAGGTTMDETNTGAKYLTL